MSIKPDAQMSDAVLSLVARSLAALEDKNEIVICSETTQSAAKYLAQELMDILPNDKLTTLEMAGLRTLVLQAISDPRFFDWEMPTLTGFTKEQFRKIAEKLPRG